MQHGEVFDIFNFEENQTKACLNFIRFSGSLHNLNFVAEIWQGIVDQPKPNM